MERGGGMDKFPLLWKDEAVGELTAEREALYTCFSVRCPLPGEGLWCAWVVGDRGELRLGVLEPQGGAGVIRRRFSLRMTAPAGRLLRGEIRPAAADATPADWLPAEDGAALFRTPWLREQLRGVTGVLWRREGETLLLALPYDPRRPLPLTGLFCFAQPRRVRGERYLVLAFDGGERPVL